MMGVAAAGVVVAVGAVFAVLISACIIAQLPYSRTYWMGQGAFFLDRYNYMNTA
jgi:uncharacterized membrane protein YccF (DUF307 family)